jgi:WD40 repeat protein
MDIQYSTKFMAVFYKNAKIIIFNIEGNEMKPVKNIDYEFPNNNHFSLSFSPNGSYLANISSNANIITIWETRNFGLRWYIDLTGETVSKIVFAPNSHDLLVMTTTGRLKYLRINPLIAEVETVRE